MWNLVWHPSNHCRLNLDHTGHHSMAKRNGHGCMYALAHMLREHLRLEDPCPLDGDPCDI